MPETNDQKPERKAIPFPVGSWPVPKKTAEPDAPAKDQGPAEAPDQATQDPRS